jgi:hypothetical protein
VAWPARRRPRKEKTFPSWHRRRLSHWTFACLCVLRYYISQKNDETKKKKQIKQTSNSIHGNDNEWETFFYSSIHSYRKDKYQTSFSYGRGKTSPNDMQIKEKVAKA